MKWFATPFRKSSEREKAIARFILTHFGYRPKQLDLFKLALRHRSAANSNETGVKNSNERLEFLGDTVLDMVIADYLYHEYPETTEGQLTKMKAKVVNRRTLNNIAQKIGLVELMELKLGKQDLHPAIIGNAFEAVIGAIYLERGFNFTNKAVLKLLKTQGLEKLVHKVVDFKSKLHEWCQKEKHTLEFAVLNESQSGGEPFFEIEALVDGEPKGKGTGRSKKIAEQVASEQACRAILNY